MSLQLNKVAEQTERVILRQDFRINIYSLLQKVLSIHVCLRERERAHYHICYFIRLMVIRVWRRVGGTQSKGDTKKKIATKTKDKNR